MIHRIDVTIADGEFVVIVGPVGLRQVDAAAHDRGPGDDHRGRDRASAASAVNEVEPKDRNIAMVFQNYALYPHMSVYDNMAYGLKIRKLRQGRDRGARAARRRASSSSAPYLQRKPRELSGGQRQRVAMGRAIVREPAAFLFDEPLSNLDAKLRVQMRLEIQKLHRELRTTSVYVTHDQVEAMTLADRMIVMNAGAVEQIGAPIEVYDDPATPFVAGFIGSPAMNFLPGKRGGDARGRGRGRAHRRCPQGLRSVAGEAVTVGIRPEHLELGNRAGTAFRFKVETIEALGADSLAARPVRRHGDGRAHRRSRDARRRRDAGVLACGRARSTSSMPRTGKRLRPRSV